MAFLSRAKSTCQVSLASSIAYATVGTTLVTMLVVPLFEVVFNVLLGNDLGAQDMLRTAYASALVAMGLGVCSGLVSKVATDRNLGIFQEVHQYRTVDIAYWAGSAVMPILLAIPTGVVSLVVITVAGGARGWSMVLNISALAVVAIFIGVLVGIAMAGIGVALSDPYQGANFANAIVPILSGVIVPVALFPNWLAGLSRAIPISGTIRALSTALQSGQLNLALLLVDVGVAAGWAVIGLAVVGLAIRRIKSGHNFSAI